MLMTRDRPVDGARIGRGRSGVVYLDRGAEPLVLARKIFGGDGASRLVMYLLYGAPNPYIWNGDAIATAVCRRRILSRLVPYWLGRRLRLPREYGSLWCADERAFALRSEFIAGHHVPLRCRPRSADQPLDELVGRVMRPLQRRLREAGFDGMLWQAGLGNPVAANNFMIEKPVESSPAPRRWVWIDLESGVPAIFPLSPAALVRFYLPWAIRHRRFLFDDVDVPKLRRYLAAEQPEIVRRLGEAAWTQILLDVDELECRQTAWKALPRFHRSIGHDQARGRITEAQAEFYRNRPVRWYARLACRITSTGARRAGRLLTSAVTKLRRIGWLRLARSTALFGFSQRFRTRLAHRYVNRRLGRWELRGCMGRDEAHRLRLELRCDETSEYLTDFCVHLAQKPIVKALVWSAAPAVTALYGPWVAAVVILLGGATARTLYTAGRCVQHAARGQRLPWIALIAGMMPSVGAMAYPLQLLHRAEQSCELPRFMIYDSFAALGRAVPIWGGADTLTEHFFNALPDRLMTRVPPTASVREGR